MLGAIAGDIFGSIYEFNPTHAVDLDLFSGECFFTDDTVHTVALAEAILDDLPYEVLLKRYYREYPLAGYGARFHAWAESADSHPYHSLGNGAAMRISPAGWAYPTLEETLARAEAYTAVTHDHPEGIKGGQATAAAIFLARNHASKDEIRTLIRDKFGYGLDRTLDEIRPGYGFTELCQQTVPEALTAFFESRDFEHAVQLAISLGGDSDTLACITGSVAEAFYGGVPARVEEFVFRKLDPGLVKVVARFNARYR